jgi:hypothetical protein
MHYACSAFFFFNLSLAYAASTKGDLLFAGNALPAQGFFLPYPGGAKGALLYPLWKPGDKLSSLTALR